MSQHTMCCFDATTATFHIATCHSNTHKHTSWDVTHLSTHMGTNTYTMMHYYNENWQVQDPKAPCNHKCACVGVCKCLCVKKGGGQSSRKIWISLQWLHVKIFSVTMHKSAGYDLNTNHQQIQIILKHAITLELLSLYCYNSRYETNPQSSVAKKTDIFNTPCLLLHIQHTVSRWQNCISSGYKRPTQKDFFGNITSLIRAHFPWFSPFISCHKVLMVLGHQWHNRGQKRALI